MAARTVRALATTAALAAGAAAGLAGVVGSASAATGCTVEYAITAQWSGGFTASVGVTNLGSAVTSWTVTWSYPAGQRVTSAWNATVGQSGTQVTATSLSYNGSVGTGAGASFGLQGAWTGSNPAPMDVAFNGVRCTGGIDGPPPSSAPSSAVPSSPASPGGPSAACPAAGHITYTLNRVTNPTPAQTSAYSLIVTAMDQAIAVYNCYTSITKALTVSYDPSVATADGNINGSIRFGATSTMQQITAMYEISHTVGVGTAGGWAAHVSGGVWTGAAATGQLRALTGDPSAVLHADSQHFWPYGLNYTSEVTSPADLVTHCRIVVALRQDLGL